MHAAATQVKWRYQGKQPNEAAASITFGGRKDEQEQVVGRTEQTELLRADEHRSQPECEETASNRKGMRAERKAETEAVRRRSLRWRKWKKGKADAQARSMRHSSEARTQRRALKQEEKSPSSGLCATLRGALELGPPGASRRAASRRSTG